MGDIDEEPINAVPHNRSAEPHDAPDDDNNEDQQIGVTRNLKFAGKK